ncbi:MAG TPA: DUF2530 domain-containing protein [Mycobacteriales bacterium]|nr:DUF2530 domain-containing protein [Mycobacteriales bacterium]
MRDRRPDPPPLETDDVRAVAVGTALWAVALVALLPFQSHLREDGRLWWYAACAFGFALGLLGLYYVRRRAAAIARERSGMTQRR